MLNLEANKDPFESLVAFVKAIVAPTKTEQDALSAAVRQGWGENFAGERSGDGRSWAALKPSTVLDRLRSGYGARPILVRTGHLRASLLSPGATDSYEQAQASGNEWQLVVGSEDAKAIFHEQGTARMPARPFIALSDQAEQRVVSALDGLIAQIEARIL
mgnify:FL=1